LVHLPVLCGTLTGERGPVLDLCPVTAIRYSKASTHPYSLIILPNFTVNIKTQMEKINLLYVKPDVRLGIIDINNHCMCGFTASIVQLTTMIYVVFCSCTVLYLTQYNTHSFH